MKLKFTLFLLFAGTLHAQTSESFSFKGQSRSYIRYTPKSYQAGMRLPLVFVLHGFTQNANSIMGYSGFNALADSNKFFVVYANGVSNAWNTNSGFPGGSTADDVGFISAIIDTMQQRFGIDAARVYSCGFSAGGFMSHRLACELGNRIAAIAAVSGTMSDAALKACTPSRAVPVMQIHGTSDLVVSYGGGISNISVDNTLKFWTAQNQCGSGVKTTSLPDRVSEGSTVERMEYSPCNNSTEVVHLKVNSGGHTWPGSSGSGVGNTNMDISASEEIWKFFNRFDLNGTVQGIKPETRLVQRIYPNPTTENLMIQLLPGMEVQHAALYAADGRNVWNMNGQASAVNIDMSAVKPGLYLLVLTGKTGQEICRVEKR